MARGDFPSAKQDQFVVRFPDGMRDRIKAAAEENGRSMNAEIVERIEESFDFPQKEYRYRVEIAELSQASDSLAAEVSELTDEISRYQQREIENVAEIRRLNIAHLEFDKVVTERRSELTALKEELSEARRVLSNYDDHSRHLQAIEKQLQTLNERLSEATKGDR